MPKPASGGVLEFNAKAGLGRLWFYDAERIVVNQEIGRVSPGLY